MAAYDRRIQSSIAALTATILLSVPALGGDFRDLARDLSRGAQRAGISRVAVVPFEATEGAASRQGWGIAEQLTTQLAELGQVQTVERNLLGKIYEEHRLARTGALAESAPRLGAMSAAQGLVTGSFSLSRGRLLIEARLIDVETGMIVAAAEAEVALPAAAEAGPKPASSRRAASVLAPAFTSAPPMEFLEEPLADFLFQPPAEGVVVGEEARPDPQLCADAARSADEMESRILELKARYWALRFKSGRGPQADPGSAIADPDLKRRFHQALRSWSERERIPALDAGELLTFLMLDHKASALRERCRI